MEIKIYMGQGEDQAEESWAKVLPLTIENIDRIQEDKDHQLFMECITKTKEIIWDNLGEVGTIIREKAFMCEISIARNGENQGWNINC